MSLKNIILYSLLGLAFSQSASAKELFDNKILNYSSILALTTTAAIFGKSLGLDKMFCDFLKSNSTEVGLGAATAAFLQPYTAKLEPAIVDFFVKNSSVDVEGQITPNLFNMLFIGNSEASQVYRKAGVVILCSRLLISLGAFKVVKNFLDSYKVKKEESKAQVTFNNTVTVN